MSWGCAALVSWSFRGSRSSIARTTLSTSWPTSIPGSCCSTPASCCAGCSTRRRTSRRAACGPVHLEEIARRFPRLTVLGAHCGNPRCEWAAEVSRWNPNVFFDLSGSTLQKMRGRLNHFQDVFWWTGVGQDTATPNNDPERVHQAGVRLRHELERIETVVGALPGALRRFCDVPQSTRPDDPGRNDVASS